MLDNLDVFGLFFGISSLLLIGGVFLWRKRASSKTGMVDDKGHQQCNRSDTLPDAVFKLNLWGSALLSPPIDWPKFLRKVVIWALIAVALAFFFRLGVWRLLLRPSFAFSVLAALGIIGLFLRIRWSMSGRRRKELENSERGFSLKGVSLRHPAYDLIAGLVTSVNKLAEAESKLLRCSGYNGELLFLASAIMSVLGQMGADFTVNNIPPSLLNSVFDTPDFSDHALECANQYGTLTNSSQAAEVWSVAQTAKRLAECFLAIGREYDQGRIDKRAVHLRVISSRIPQGEKIKQVV